MPATSGDDAFTTFLAAANAALDSDPPSEDPFAAALAAVNGKDKDVGAAA